MYRSWNETEKPWLELKHQGHMQYTRMNETIPSTLSQKKELMKHTESPNN